MDADNNFEGHVNEISGELKTYLDNTIREENNESKINKNNKIIHKSSDVNIPNKIPSEFYEFNINDMGVLTHSAFKERKIAGHHIESMNNLCDVGLNQIITQLYSATDRFKNERKDTGEDENISDISFEAKFTRSWMTKPEIATSNKTLNSNPVSPLTPNFARLSKLTYSSNLYANVVVTAEAFYSDGRTKVVKSEINDLLIAKIPAMVGSKYCTTYGLDKEALINIEEDPKDPGGYFIVNGIEYAVDNLENIHINDIQAYKTTGLVGEIARTMIISKPGDGYENSSQIIARYMSSGAITIELTTGKKEKFEIPFYVLFRVFGVTCDKDIINLIVYGTENKDQVSLKMYELLEKAFNVKASAYSALKKGSTNRIVDNEKLQNFLKSRNQVELINFIAEKYKNSIAESNYKRDTDAHRFVHNTTSKMLDEKILPHIGTTEESRIRKCWFIGHLINKLLLIKEGLLDQTDRDSYKNKRVHTAGVSFAKTFKTHFNFAIIQVIKKNLKNEFINTPFSKVKLDAVIKAHIKDDELEKVLVKSITVGDKVFNVNKREVNNRISSQILYRKNMTNVYSVLNTINTANSSSNSKNDRSDEMRRVHPTYTGFIGVSQSADTGDRVGTAKQLGVTVSISESGISGSLKATLWNDPSVIKMVSFTDPALITVNKLSKVFVNGDWIGLCADSHNLVKKYRELRRHGNGNDISHTTSIIWDPMIREVHFWVDNGRLLRPFIIVYNNLAEYIGAYHNNKAYIEDNSSNDKLDIIDKLDNSDRTKKHDPKGVRFTQWTLLTPQHVKDLRDDKITMNDLRKQGVIEYLAPEELENAYVAYSYSLLSANRHNIEHQFTHCDLELSIFGIVELSAPFTNNTPGTRITMFTNHKKMACGFYALNWPFRIDNDVVLQYYCEYPIVRTFSDAFTNPDGQNAIVAYAMYGGMNQEDSAIVNQSSVDRGLFNASFFKHNMAQLEKNEVWGNNNLEQTMDIRAGARYNLVDKDGYVKVGSKVTSGDVLFVKRSKITNPAPDSKYLYIDRSVLNKLKQEAYVDRVIKIDAGIGENHATAKVKLRIIRPLKVGDKISSTNGNKSIVGVMLNEADMPYAEDGLVPDLIINPHAIPTRMVIGQMIATLLGIYAVSKGTILDAKPFSGLDLNSVVADLEKMGIKYAGHRRLYNGMQGNYLDTLIFMGPVSYQRIKKFVNDNAYAIKRGPTSTLTRQPLEGRAVDGGLRLGEMEKDCIITHGSMRTLHHKFFADSDGCNLPICKGCGKPAIVNDKEELYICKNCNENADIYNVSSSWASNIFLHELSALGVDIKFDLDPIMFEGNNK